MRKIDGKLRFYVDWKNKTVYVDWLPVRVTYTPPAVPRYIGDGLSGVVVII
jgi:hypothetical protein